MTATDTRATSAAPVGGAPARAVPVARGYRFELVKLLSQWRIRLVILACWIAPALFVAAVVSRAPSRSTPCSAARCMPRAGPDRWWCSDSRASGRSRC